ncbi:hypothetical protein A0H81_11283 [Grifola frondosa]|uniref:Uncharacterized protein n=1 Tax=Grifola frondosa TaxID=5627 RepID=A0A1C7LVJ9_GRIFR|nr:hypothetical protein A0H81_11283 [Grifola frondosa]
MVKPSFAKLLKPVVHSPRPKLPPESFAAVLNNEWDIVGSKVIRYSGLSVSTNKTPLHTFAAKSDHIWHIDPLFLQGFNTTSNFFQMSESAASPECHTDTFDIPLDAIPGLDLSFLDDDTDVLNAEEQQAVDTDTLSPPPRALTSPASIVDQPQSFFYDDGDSDIDAIAETIEWVDNWPSVTVPPPTFAPLGGAMGLTMLGDTHPPVVLPDTTWASSTDEEGGAEYVLSAPVEDELPFDSTLGASRRVRMPEPVDLDSASCDGGIVSDSEHESEGDTADSNSSRGSSISRSEAASSTIATPPPETGVLHPISAILREKYQVARVRIHAAIQMAKLSFVGQLGWPRSRA